VGNIPPTGRLTPTTGTDDTPDDLPPPTLPKPTPPLLRDQMDRTPANKPAASPPARPTVRSAMRRVPQLRVRQQIEAESAEEAPPSIAESEAHRRVERGGDADLYRRFAAMPIFEGVEESLVEHLYRQGATVAYPTGARLYDDHDQLDDVAVLLKGSVRLGHASLDGREMMSGLRSAPHVLGLTEMLAETSAVGSAEALERCVVVRVPASVFEEAIAASGALAKNVLRTQAESLVRATRQQESIAFDAVDTRLAKLLCGYMDRYGLPAPGGVMIRLPLRQHQLANSLGVSVRSIRRAFTRWAAEGIVSKDTGRWIVREPNRMRELAGLAPK
jgi:CRP/FNR family transcriptional regulator, cyclic AMP receptor protein